MPPTTRLQSGAIKRKYTGAEQGSNSPWDPTSTKEVNVDALDLHKSYQEEYLSRLADAEDKARLQWEMNRPAKETWKNPNPDKKPMNDPRRLPRGWTDVDFDLADECV